MLFEKYLHHSKHQLQQDNINTAVVAVPGYFTDAQKQKVPYMLVIGDKEMENGEVALRKRSGENPGPMKINEFVALCKDEVARKI